MNNDILIIIYRDNYEDMFRAMNELMNYLVDLKDSMSIDKRRATIDICGHIRVTFRCGDVYKMAGLRPNYYETWSWEADKFLAPSAAKCCGKKMPSLEGIAYIIQKEVKEKTMIKIENVEVMGWEHAIRGIRNPMNSWEKSDSGICKGGDDGIGCENCANYDSCEHTYDHSWQLGKADHDLMMRLADTRYRRMITVNLDITAPLYWWKDFYTYEVGTVANSCSTMHKITAKEFEWSDFSTEHLLNFGMWGEQFTDADAIYAPAKTMGCVISALNGARDRYLDFKSRGSEWTELAKRAWWKMTQLLPSSYNQKWTVMLNYEVLAGIYPMLRNHELDEWVKFCKWIEALPYSDIIIGRVWR